MVKIIQKQSKELYQCEECGFKYAEKEWAEKCEVWCKEQQSCNIEIIAHGTPSEDTAKDGDLLNEEDGDAYFNKFKIVELTPKQEALVTKIAQNTYRPCCNNSTFFQDCNHGSALLGLLQLGAAQGLTEDELYREALAFNSFWFPQNYIETALYFKAVKNVDWEDIDPKVVMDKVSSSEVVNILVYLTQKLKSVIIKQ